MLEIAVRVKHEETMKELQQLWEKNYKEVYEKQHDTFIGIRSSQISALVDLLIRKGII